MDFDGIGFMFVCGVEVGGAQRGGGGGQGRK